MAIESEADRLAFFDVADDGVAASINAATIYGIFDDDHIEIGDISTTGPQFLCRTSDATAASVARGNTITINSVSRTVRDIQPDGTGLTLLILEDQ